MTVAPLRRFNERIENAVASCFNSSSTALQAYRAKPQRFDCILTDDVMPDLTGTALAREIWRIRPAPPILLMSGYGGPQLSQRAAVIGINEGLRKPLQRRDLAQSLAGWWPPVAKRHGGSPAPVGSIPGMRCASGGGRNR